MPLDTRIALGVQPARFADPLETAGKALGLRNLLQRSEVQQQEQQINAEELKKIQAANREHELSQKEDAALQALWEKHAGNPDAILKEAGGIVRPKTMFELRKSFDAERASKSKLKTDELPLSKYRNEQLGGLTAQAMALSDEEYAQQWANITATAKGIDPELELPEQPIPKKDLGVLRLRFMTGATLDSEEEERRKKAEEARKLALAPSQQKKAEQDAIAATQKAAGTEPIQPAEQARIDRETKAATETGRHNLQTERHARAMEARLAKIETAGLTRDQNQRVTQIANQFDNEPAVKNYQTQAEGKSFVDSLATGAAATAGDDQGLLYAFAKAMDPGSVVREGEYATVQKYSQSWAETYGFNAKRVFANVPFLTEQARKNMKDTITKKVDASKKGYQNVHKEYGRRIKLQAGVPDGERFLTDYGQAFDGNEAPTSDLSGVSNDELFKRLTPSGGK